MYAFIIFFAAWVFWVPLSAQADSAHQHGENHTPVSLVQPEIIMDGSLLAGRKNALKLGLKHRDGGFPVFWEELAEVHESRIHLLIIDPALGDYHHEHPTRTDREGIYNFAFKPRTACSYKVWAQIHFKDGREEEVTAMIPGVEDCATQKPDRAENGTVESGGYHFTMMRDKDVMKKGEDIMLTLKIADANGAPMAELEPVMGAFAHLVGFYEDYNTIAHIHPLGEAPGGVHDRGGPELMFHYRPDRAGLVRMYAQVKINGAMVFAPFTMVVVE
ncbi:MAG: hypothetical protein KKA05_01375 [Alphaproteobacteria bacterium]|nr:hypothetical protein [Alphaproteobacteria bacterium]